MQVPASSTLDLEHFPATSYRVSYSCLQANIPGILNDMQCWVLKNLNCSECTGWFLNVN